MRFSGTGCQPCRDSRKKCDDGKPACSRCIRSGKRCHGYREAFSIVHAENVYASRQQKRPRGPRRRQEDVADVSVGLPRDVQSEALAYYLHHHFGPVDGHSTLTENIEQSLASTWTSTPALFLAVSSLSMAIFSRVKRQQRAAKEASISYQESLRALRIALPDVSKTNVDACLLTTYFLARYEDSVYDVASHTRAMQFQRSRSRMHFDGMTAGLDYWRRSCGGTQEATCVIKHARRVLRKAALLGQYDMPYWLADGASFGESGFDLELDLILARLIDVRAELPRLLRGESPSQPIPLEIVQKLSSLQEAALAIDEALIGWMQLCPGLANYPTHKLAEHEVGSKPNFYEYQTCAHWDPNKAIILAQCYGYRILATHIRIQILGVMEQHANLNVSEQLLECAQTIEHLACDLACIIPFCLGKLMVSDDVCTVLNDHEVMPRIAELVATPLAIASTTPYIDVKYSKWFRSQLGSIGRLTGYGIMESVAGSELFKL